LTLTVSATIFGLAVGLLAFFGLTIFSLRLAMAFQSCRMAATITAIGLASPAASANAKSKRAPSTLDKKQ
jgi:hypothetical protein